jgi:hypothetical protein
VVVGAAHAESRQTTIKIVTAHFKKMGIPLEKPNPKHAFWRQPIQKIADRLAVVVNTLPMPKAAPVVGPKITTVHPKHPAPKHVASKHTPPKHVASKHAPPKHHLAAQHSTITKPQA